MLLTFMAKLFADQYAQLLPFGLNCSICQGATTGGEQKSIHININININMKSEHEPF